MGQRLFDQYTLLHFAVGVVAYFFDLPLTGWFLIHTAFEYLENTPTGMTFINQLPIWPGGKPAPDSLLNSVGDTIGALSGWLVAAELDRLGRARQWYKQ